MNDITVLLNPFAYYLFYISIAVNSLFFRRFKFGYFSCKSSKRENVVSCILQNRATLPLYHAEDLKPACRWQLKMNSLSCKYFLCDIH
jgi:hypothetical protein